MAARKVNLDALREFVRTKAIDFLRDPNINSVGIGYKVTKGVETKQLAVQFTVDAKAAPEALGGLGSVPIPKTFTVGGVEVPTDVVQRKYRPTYRVVQSTAKGERRTRRDPIQPGISVGNARERDAGTLGCVVYDAQSGDQYILSNWHVLHGPAGKVGDVIVQPGGYDDDRVDQNHVGVLVRSHLGLAGDCAVARVEGRGVDATVLDLGVTVKQLAVPVLGDRVVKSGRTTAVTHGKVRRVDVTSKINYGGATGPQLVGGFEIGPDPSHPAPAGEISEGGDSGSTWLLKDAQGKPTAVMAGLHFAGEMPGAPDEHALACYAHAVFKKLEIVPVPPAVPAAEAQPRGYDPAFLGSKISAPTLRADVASDAFRLKGRAVIDYVHFSLALSKSRRMARWVAWNIDGAKLKAYGRKGLDFGFDPRIPAKYQVGNALYRNNRLDRGHIARRADLVWGPPAEAQAANRESFYYTNITPQHEDFNQSDAGGIWGLLENAVLEGVDADDLRATVFGGPIFRDSDLVYRDVRIPRDFWKVVVYVDADDHKAKAQGFIVTQEDLLGQLEAIGLEEFRVYQVPIEEIESRTHLDLGDAKKIQVKAPEPERVRQRAETRKAVGVREIRSFEDARGA